MTNMTIIKIIKTKLCLFTLVFLNLYAMNVANAKSTAGSFISVADIHFNPFDACAKEAKSCELVTKLRGANADDWDTILAQYDTSTPVYGTDTNYRLFKSTLVELNKQANLEQAQFALALGDFLVHDFKQLYQLYSQDVSKTGSDEFTDKALLYVMQQLKRAMPTISIYPVVGNNDTYGEHYTTEPRFYQQQAAVWSQLIINKFQQVEVTKSFAKGGYYAVSPSSNLRIIVLNTSYFSTMAENTDEEASSQLDWLHQQLQIAALRKQSVLIALHIAPGVDVYKTIRNDEINLLWVKKYSRRFRNELKAYGSRIMGILPGHAHMDWWEVIKAGDAEIPMSGTPGISPLYGNNPAFKVYYYQGEPGRLVDYATYYTSLAENDGVWQKEYEFSATYLNQLGGELLTGMNALTQKGKLTDLYKKYYAVSRDAQPITTENKWLPYYWCSVHFYTTKKYSNCLKD